MKYILYMCVALSLSGCAYFFDAPPADVGEFYVGAYQIGPGDSLQVSVWKDPEITRTLTVRPDGYISLPLVGDILASGRTPEELSAIIEKELSATVQDPRVVVVVGTVAARSDSSIRVVGEAVQPQLIPYFDGITLIDVATGAGGLTEFADGNRAYIVRIKEGQRARYRVRLGSLLNAGDMRANVPLAPGDVLVIPERWY